MAGERPTGRRTRMREEDPYAVYRRPAENPQRQPAQRVSESTQRQQPVRRAGESTQRQPPVRRAGESTQRQPPVRRAGESTQRQLPVRRADQARARADDDYATDYDAPYAYTDDDAYAYADEPAYAAAPRRRLRARHVLLFILLLLVVGAAIWLGLLNLPPNPFAGLMPSAEQTPALAATEPPAEPQAADPEEQPDLPDQANEITPEEDAAQPLAEPPTPLSAGGPPLTVPADALSWDGQYLLRVQVENGQAAFVILAPDGGTVVYQCPETWADDDVKLIAWGMNDYDVEVRTTSEGRLTFGATREGDAISTWRRR